MRHIVKASQMEPWLVQCDRFSVSVKVLQRRDLKPVDKLLLLALAEGPDTVDALACMGRLVGVSAAVAGASLRRLAAKGLIAIEKHESGLNRYVCLNPRYVQRGDIKPARLV